MRQHTGLVFRVVAAINACSVGPAGAIPPPDGVAGGATVVYNVGELTKGAQTAAGNIRTLLSQSVEPGECTAAGGKSAACVAAPDQLTARAPLTVHQGVAQMLEQLAETRGCSFGSNTRLSSARSTQPRVRPPWSSATRPTARPSPAQLIAS